jgi:hypothetical protein
MRPTQGTIWAGDSPGRLMRAITAQPLSARASKAPTLMPWHPLRGQTRSGAGRTSTFPGGTTLLVAAASCACTAAATLAVSSSGPGAFRGSTIRGHSTTAPPATPTERLISGASPELFATDGPLGGGSVGEAPGGGGAVVRDSLGLAVGPGMSLTEEPHAEASSPATAHATNLDIGVLTL